MRVLLLAPELPYPPRRGVTIRSWYFLRWLASEHEVSLLASDSRAEVAPELRSLCREVRVVAPPSRPTAARLGELATTALPDLALRLCSTALEEALAGWLKAERFDAVQVEGLEMTLPWLRVCSRLGGVRPLPFSLLDEQNAEFLLQWRAFRSDLAKPARWTWAAYSLLQSAKLWRYEARACRAFASVVACSEEDASALLGLGLRVRPRAIPNGVDCAYFAFRPPSALPPPNVVFTGTMGFRPNVDAVVWFVDEVWPLVRRRLPEARFTVVGAKPSPAVLKLADRPGVVITGGVADVRPYLAASAAYAIPMRIGGGVRLKALEAMASGVPVVSTGLGCAGTTAEPGRHYLVAESPADFADRLVEVLTGQRDCRHMLGAARRLMEERYDWRWLSPMLAESYADMTAAVV